MKNVAIACGIVGLAGVPVRARGYRPAKLDGAAKRAPSGVWHLTERNVARAGRPGVLSNVSAEVPGWDFAAVCRRSQLKSFDAEARPESGEGRFAPEWWWVGERCVGVTHLKALDRLALTIRLVAEAGGIPPNLDELSEVDAPVRRMLHGGRRGTCEGPGACLSAYLKRNYPKEWRMAKKKTSDE